MLNGIIIVATGSPMYGRLAYNLAVTIKAVENFPVALLCSGAGMNHISKDQQEVFDYITIVPEHAYAAKLKAYDYSPFENTLYLDADMAWLPKRKPSDLFRELKDIKFAAITEGFYDYDTGKEENSTHYHFWCNPIGAKEAYGLTGILYQWRSEVMYFKKCPEVKALFDMAAKVHADPKVEYQKFGGAVPDEIGINIAACKHGIHPHVRRWKPAYWHRLHGHGASLQDIVNEYYLLSVGGSFASSAVRRCYDTVVRAAHNKLGLQFLFNLRSKRDTIKERSKM